MDDYMYSIREMSKLMDMSIAELRQARIDGKGPAFIRVNGKILYPASALAAWDDQIVGRNETQ